MTAGDRINGLVLTGGRSRRMGQDKALLKRNGESQLDRSMCLLHDHLEQVYVSVRMDQSGDPERARYPQIVDRYSDLGPIAGILSAMDADPGSAWLVLACDLPNLDPATIRYLLQHHSKSQPFTAYRSSFDGLPEPLCAIYNPESRSVIDEFVADGVHCPRKIMIRSDTCLLEQPNPGALDNINTPEELMRSAVGRAS